MKFRNKKTGEVKDWDFSNWYQAILNPENKEKYECNLNDFIDRVVKFREEWEDAKAEPLIKDKKIRKALRAWAEACNIPNDVQLDVFEYLGTGKTAIQYPYEAKTEPCKRCVQFEYISSDKVYSSQNDRKHTIAELCGEEEEWSR